jgi:hypothetical protein
MLAAPQRPRICLQQARSDAVIPEAGSAQAIAGASSDTNVRRAGPIRVTACTDTRVPNCGQRRLQQLAHNICFHAQTSDTLANIRQAKTAVCYPNQMQLKVP